MKQRPRKYQKPFSLYPMTLEQVVDKVLAYKPKPKKQSRITGAVRALIGLPPDLYETLEEIAKQKKVSLAWVVREAAEKYVADGKPPLRDR